MIIFRHDAGAAVYNACIGFDSASSITTAKKTLLALARRDAWTVSIVEFLRKREFRGGQRQKTCFDTLGNFLRSAIMKLVRAAGQFAECWHPEKLKVETASIFVEFYKTVVLEMSRSVTCILLLAFSSRIFFSHRRSLVQHFIFQKS